ncbi:hypothetical protein DAEQUDRAFT_732700 [Daedalea quercina L-15889]|uniref:Uncharacterized protein n=1 Tax=Daedalea quercina L-15889 TaxID=1314783 RepID=A0A165LGP7_9APHY|nr:hypothetical protein DAEQUDRAFT_732700 [Daedalea quercina L-15889]
MDLDLSPLLRDRSLQLQACQLKRQRIEEVLEPRFSAAGGSGARALDVLAGPANACRDRLSSRGTRAGGRWGEVATGTSGAAVDGADGLRQRLLTVALTGRVRRWHLTTLAGSSPRRAVSPRAQSSPSGVPARLATARGRPTPHRPPRRSPPPLGG